MEEVAVLLSSPSGTSKRDFGQLLLTGDFGESRGGGASRKKRRPFMPKDSIPQLAGYDEEPSEWLHDEMDDDDLQWAEISGPSLSGPDFDVPETSIFDILESSSEPSGYALGSSNAVVNSNAAWRTDGAEDFIGDEDSRFSGSPLPKFFVPWTEEEDTVIRDGVEKQLGWSEISAKLMTRSSTQCSQRWRKVLDPNVKRFVLWTPEEDAILTKLHQENEGMSNKKMANFLPGRTPTQCHNRWVEVLDPKIRRGPYTKLEDERLMQLRQEGLGWAMIAKFPELEGRANVSLKNRWRTLERRKNVVKKKISKPAPPRKVEEPRRRRWTLAEDALLLKLHADNPGISSKDIATHFTNRSRKQCHSRWMECINPNIRRDPFSPEEDALLVRFRDGQKGWAEMVQHPLLKNRSYTACKNRFRAIVRQVKEEEPK
eukprot:Stramenopile-MAST_4_protein_669